MSVSLILEKFPNIPQEDLVELINVIEQSKNFSNHFTSCLPTNEFELEYAEYLANNNRDFLKKYKEIVTIACFREFLEWYEYLTKHILDNDVQGILGINFSASNLNWEEEFKKSEIIGWAFKITDHKIFLKNIHKAKEIGHSMVNFFNSRRSLSTLDDDYFESDHAQLVLDSIDEILIKDNLQVLESQVHSDKIICMIEVYGWDSTFNHILLDWIHKNKNRVSKWI